MVEYSTKFNLSIDVISDSFSKAIKFSSSATNRSYLYKSTSKSESEVLGQIVIEATSLFDVDK